MRRCNTFAEGEHETIYWARIALKWCVIEYMSSVPMHPLAQIVLFSEININKRSNTAWLQKDG